MSINEFMRSIGFSEKYIQAVGRVAVSEEEVEGLPSSPLLEASYTGDRPDQALALFVHYLAKYSEQAYHVRGVTRAEWFDTMHDLVIWAHFLRRERGEIGLRETGWLSHLVRTEIFRLGRLQFLPRLSEEEVVFNGLFLLSTEKCCGN